MLQVILISSNENLVTDRGLPMFQSTLKEVLEEKKIEVYYGKIMMLCIGFLIFVLMIKKTFDFVMKLINYFNFKLHRQARPRRFKADIRLPKNWIIIKNVQCN